MSYIVGVDLGQVQDYTAVAVAERQRQEPHATYQIRHLERFPLGTPYPVVADRVSTLVHMPPLQRDVALAVDATGVGMPVVDLLKQHCGSTSILGGVPILAITITGGEAVSQEGHQYRVPKRDLVSTLQVLLQGGRLKVAQDLPEAATLVKELLNFKVKITIHAHDTYGARREGTHDGLVLAVALAC